MTPDPTPTTDRATAHAIDRAHRAFITATAALVASLAAVVMSVIALAD